MSAPAQNPESGSPNTPDTAPLRIKKLQAIHGFLWLKHAVALFRQAPGTWIGCTFLLTVFTMFILVLPFLIPLLAVFVGGLVIGAKKLAQQQDFTVNDLFAGFQNNFGGLISVGGIYLLLSIVANLLAIQIAKSMGYEVTDISSTDAPQTAEQIWAIFQARTPLVFTNMLVMIPVFMGFWFAPALVVMRNMSATEAFKSSFRAALNNILPFVVYFLAWLLIINFSVLALAIVGSLLGTGIIVLLLFGFYLVFYGIYMVSIYTSYVAVFEQTDQQDQNNNDSDDSRMIV